MDLDERLGYKFSYPAIKDAGKSQIILEVAICKRRVEEGNEVLKELPVIKEWYKLIAEANSLDIWHPLVAEAYWLGSTLLDREFDLTQLHEYIITNFPDKFPNKDRIPVPPSGHPPHHNLHVDVYGIVSRPEFTSDEIEECRIIPARIISAQGDAESIIDSKKLRLQNPFNYQIYAGLPVAVHHNKICAIINEVTIDSIMKYGFRLQDCNR